MAELKHKKEHSNSSLTSLKCLTKRIRDMIKQLIAVK